MFRTLGALATLISALAATSVSAQYVPMPRVYPPAVYPPPAQAYPPYQPLPGVLADEEDPVYDPPMGRPAPPAPVGPPLYQPLPPLGAAASRNPSTAVEEAELPPLLPPGAAAYPTAPYPGPAGYREPPPQQGQAYEPAASASRPYYGPPFPAAALAPGEDDGVRPPLPIGPGQSDGRPTGTVPGDPRNQFASLPPDVRPETGPVKQLPPHLRRTLVDFRTKEPAGTIVIDTQNTYLYLVLGDGKALRYGVGVGREGFTWSGAEKVTRMAEWPDWNPPPEMIERQPYLPRFMAGGETNPLGARALYLGKTVYRIHGTNQPSTIGTFVSSGCIRLTNEDVMDLYSRVKMGTRVVVLPGHAPATAAATSLAPPMPPSAPPVSMAPLGPPPGPVIAR